MKRDRKISIFVVLLVALFTAFFLYEASFLVINGDFTRFFPWDEGSDTYYGGEEGQTPILAMEREEGEVLTDYIISQDYRTGFKAVNGIGLEEEKDYPYTSTMYVLVQSENIWNPEFLDELERAIDAIEERKDSARPESILDSFTISGEDAHLGLIPMSAREGKKWSEEEAVEFRRRAESDPTTKYILIGGSGNSFLLKFIYADFSSMDQLSSISSAFDNLRDMGAKVVLMSNMVIALHVIESISRDLMLLSALALALVFAVYCFSFHSFSLALLTSSVSAISLIWTMGTMAIRGMDLNLMNLLTPFMVLTLGSTYSMHVISAYVSRPLEIRSSGFRATKSVLTTIIVGSITTVSGFVVLSLSPLEGLVSFGVSVSIGVVFCALLSTTYLPSMLTLLPPLGKRAGEKVKRGFFSRLIKGIGRFVVGHWILFIILFVILVAFGFSLKDRIGVESSYISYFPEGDEFGEECRYFAREMGGTTPFTVTITAPEGSDRFFLDMENLRAVKRWEESVSASPHVLNIISFPSYVAFANREITGEWDIPKDPGLGRIMQAILLSYASSFSQLEAIVGRDFNSLTVTIQAWNGKTEDLLDTESATEVYEAMVSSLPLLPEGTEVTVSGYPVISTKFSNRLMDGQESSTIYALLSVFLISSLALLSLSKGLAVLIPVFSGMAMNYIFMYFLGIPFDIITVSFSSIAVGAGVDDAIHLSLRYRKIRKSEAGLDSRKALYRAIRTTGRPIVMTTLSVVAGLLILLFASYTPIRYFGLLMSVTLTGCMLATIFFLPPFLILFHRIKNLLRSLFRRNR